MNESDKRFYHSITNNAVKRHKEFSNSKKEDIWESYLEKTSNTNLKLNFALFLLPLEQWKGGGKGVSAFECVQFVTHQEKEKNIHICSSKQTFASLRFRLLSPVCS